MTKNTALINFIVYCYKGIIFLKSVDAFDIYESAENLCHLFANFVITEFGSSSD